MGDLLAGGQGPRNKTPSMFGIPTGDRQAQMMRDELGPDTIGLSGLPKLGEPTRPRISFGDQLSTLLTPQPGESPLMGVFRDQAVKSARENQANPRLVASLLKILGL